MYCTELRSRHLKEIPNRIEQSRERTRKNNSRRIPLTRGTKFHPIRESSFHLAAIRTTYTRINYITVAVHHNLLNKYIHPFVSNRPNTICRIRVALTGNSFRGPIRIATIILVNLETTQTLTLTKRREKRPPVPPSGPFSIQPAGSFDE